MNYEDFTSIKQIKNGMVIEYNGKKYVKLGAYYVRLDMSDNIFSDRVNIDKIDKVYNANSKLKYMRTKLNIRG